MTENRREFLGHSSTAAAFAAGMFAANATASAAETDPINVAIIGPGGMGSNHVSQLVTNKTVRLTTVCEVDENRAAKAADTVLDAKGLEVVVAGDEHARRVGIRDLDIEPLLAPGLVERLLDE